MIKYLQKGKLVPPRNRYKVSHAAVDFPHKQMFEEKNQINKWSISKCEWDGLMEPRNNKDTIMKEADRDESVVIMNTKHYPKMVSNHLNDNKN